MSYHTKSLFFFLSLFLISLPSALFATTYIVAPTGSDTNPGTAAAPWKTIQKAASTMNPGDTVNVQPGTYNEQVTVNRSGAAGALITLQASGLAKVMQGFIVNANYIVIDGFDITNSLGTPLTANGILVNGASCLVQNNYIHDLRYQGIRIGSETDSATPHNNVVRNNAIVRAAVCGIDVGGRSNLIEDNEISHTLKHPPGGDVGAVDADGVRFFGSAHVIRQNYIHDILCTDPGNTGPHIDCFQTWGPAYNITFEQNRCDNHETYDSQGCQPHAAMIHSPGGAAVHDLTFRNNLFTTQVGLLIFDTAQLSFVNNTMISRSTNDGKWSVGIEIHTSPSFSIQNNLFYNVGQNVGKYLNPDPASLVGSTVGYNCHFMDNGIPPAGSPYPHDLWQVNPLLVNASGGNFHLQAGSPLTNAGASLGFVLSDFDGIPRPQGGALDIGAYEILAPTAPSTMSALSR